MKKTIKDTIKFLETNRHQPVDVTTIPGEVGHYASQAAVDQEAARLLGELRALLSR